MLRFWCHIARRSTAYTQLKARQIFSAKSIQKSLPSNNQRQSISSAPTRTWSTFPELSGSSRLLRATSVFELLSCCSEFVCSSQSAIVDLEMLGTETFLQAHLIRIEHELASIGFMETFEKLLRVACPHVVLSRREQSKLPLTFVESPLHLRHAWIRNCGMKMAEALRLLSLTTLPLRKDSRRHRKPSPAQTEWTRSAKCKRKSSPWSDIADTRPDSCTEDHEPDVREKDLWRPWKWLSSTLKPSSCRKSCGLIVMRLWKLQRLRYLQWSQLECNGIARRVRARRLVQFHTFWIQWLRPCPWFGFR